MLEHCLFSSRTSVRMHLLTARCIRSKLMCEGNSLWLEDCVLGLISKWTSCSRFLLAVLDVPPNSLRLTTTKELLTCRKTLTSRFSKWGRKGDAFSVKQLLFFCREWAVSVASFWYASCICDLYKMPKVSCRCKVTWKSCEWLLNYSYLLYLPLYFDWNSIVLLLGRLYYLSKTESESRWGDIQCPMTEVLVFHS